MEENTDLFPDWELIDEISINLLEQGIGTFDVLQRALPSIENDITEERLIKLFRLAQLQIQYILKTQRDLVDNLCNERARAKKFSKECHTFRKTFTKTNTLNPLEIECSGDNIVKSNELFKCNECSKIFLHSSFLCNHIQRRHGSGGNSAMSKRSSYQKDSLPSSSTNTSVWK